MPDPRTPFHIRDGVAIYLADARDVLPELPQGRAGAGLLLTDPPYGTSTSVTGDRSHALALNHVSGDDASNASVVGEVLGAAWRALRFRRHAYIFGPFDISSLTHAGAVTELIWDKQIATMGNLELPWAQRHERISFAIRYDGKVGAARGGLAARLRRGSVLSYPRPHASGAKRHPTEKPVALLRELIECSSVPGDVVLDPFAGSGSTLVAALLEGRGAVGIDLEEPWCEMAAKRVDAVADLLHGIDAIERLARLGLADVGAAHVA